MDDAELLQSYAEHGDEKAFAELVRRHMGFVYSIALRRACGNVPLAEEASQDVFVAMGRKARLLSQHEALKAWLYTAARYAAANHVQTEQRRQVREKAQASMETSQREPGPLEWDRLRPLLDEALDHLSERDRNAVILRFFEARSFGEIGRIQGVSEDGARLRINRALDKLATAIGRRGITSTAAGLALGFSSETLAAVNPGLIDVATRSALSVLQASPPISGSSVKLFKVLSSSKVGLGVAALVAGVAVAGWREWSLVVNRDRTIASLQQQIDRDRGEIRFLLRKQSQAQAALRGIALAADQADILAKRVGFLRDWFTRNPDLVIPEFHLLKDRDWVAFAYEHPEIDIGGDLRRVASGLRNEARRSAVAVIQKALQAYVASSGGQPLNDSSALLAFGPLLDTAILARYTAFPDIRAIQRFASTPSRPALVSHPELDDSPTDSGEKGTESWTVITENSTSGSSRIVGDNRAISAWP